MVLAGINITCLVPVDPIRLTVWSSNEKFELLSDVAGEYSRFGPRVDGRCVTIEVAKITSGDAEFALTHDSRARPQVWSPAARTWVRLLKQHRQDLNLPDIMPLALPPLTQSPLVIAMPEPMAETLKQAGVKPSWREILRLARDPAGWARYGQPWGAFKLGKTNPYKSTSGAHAVIATFNAAAEKTGPLTFDDIGRPEVRKFVRDVESIVVEYHDSLSDLLTELRAADDRDEALTYLSAIPAEEKQIFEYNRGNPQSVSPCCPLPPPKVPLVAVFLSDGTIMADHPYVILEGVESIHRAAAEAFSAHLQRDVQSRFLKEGFRDHLGQAPPELDPRFFERDVPVSVVSLPAPEVLVQMLLLWSESRARGQVPSGSGGGG